MHKFIYLFLVTACLFSCTQSPDSQPKKTAFAYGDHHSQKTLIDLDSTKGQQLYQKIDKAKFAELKKYWIPQEKNYCGVCSIVIASNSLNGKKRLNQTTFFNEESSAILPAKIVSRMGLTLSELEANAKIHNPTRIVKKYNSLQTGSDKFRRFLIQNKKSDDIRIIVNFSRKSLAGTGMSSGHFSIVADYLPSEDLVLILEVNAERNHFWVKRRDLFNAMLAVDPVSQIPRGWIIITEKTNRPVIKLRYRTSQQ
mgnify:CR=1 FL=1